MGMPTKGQRTTVQEDGTDKDAYVVAFTNGALAELEDLQTKLNLDDVEAVVKLAIAVLRQVEAGNNAGKPPIS